MVIRKDIDERKNEFISRAKELWGDRYDYSEVEYVNADTPVRINCTLKYHKPFMQIPHSHLIGKRGCHACRTGFFEKSQQKFGEKFDYSLAQYEKDTKPVKIICPTHGVFEIEPRNHLRSVHGCEECFFENYRKFNTTEEFIKASKSIHGDKYSYEKTEYKNSVKDKVIVTCRLHGDITTEASHHVREEFGGGCFECMKEGKTLTEDQFIQKSKSIHSEFFDYSKVNYVNSYTKVTLICPSHGNFEISPDKHMKGNGCKKCFVERRTKTTEEFIKDAQEVHGNTYDYSEYVYTSIHEPSTIICRVHGEFYQSRSNHIHAKQGCPRCINKSEGKVAIILNEIAVVHRTYRIDKDDGSGERFYYDFYLPEYNLIIERDGEQHYKETFFQEKRKRTEQENDRQKTELAKSKGFRVARIPYWLSDDEVKLEVSNILEGNPSYPDVPDLQHEETKPKPVSLD